ncbi:MAG: DEAD/DEAH box helicase [Actinomycetes bacterium]
MSTPAERFAAAQERQRADATQLARFAEQYPFGLDEFQLDAARALEDGQGVLVAAPTGSGKTVVGEFAIHLALARGLKCFYTTPIKALSNQKFHDLVDRHGSAQIGLLTGDNSINGDAPVVVMTTEVLRNMLYAGSGTLANLGFVVMDEVHYLADRSRGAVWEEVIIHLPETVTVAALSATVSNAEEFGEWLGEVRGRTAVVVSEHRPVPLWQQVQVGTRLFDLFVDDDQREVNPELLRMARDEERLTKLRGHRPRRGERRGRPPGVPTRADVVEALGRRELLPAIVFIFSRAGCDAAVRQLLGSGVRLTPTDSREEIRRIAEERTGHLPDDDLAVLGYGEWLEGLERGFASHHAGLLPAFKEVVEELFASGLIHVVFATETLALGINMPARTVVLEKLSKWNGETHADVTPAEYTQLTGRAGRRGIDVEGDAVVLWQPGFDPRALAGLASTRTYPLRSSFRPTYNMAVNLVRQMGRHTAREVLESSFAQFQADRAVVGLARQVRRNEETLAGYQTSMTCHLGDFAEYAALRAAISDHEKQQAREAGAARRAEAQASLSRLQPGDVVEVPGGKRSGVAVVLSSERDPHRREDPPRVVVMTQRGQVRRISPTEVTAPMNALERLKLPKSFNARNAQARRDLGNRLRGVELPPRTRARNRSAGGDDVVLLDLRAALRAHPCHGCAEREDHARWGERFHRLQRETDDVQRRIEQRTNTIARTFDRVLTVLQELGYIKGDEVQPSGDRLARIYGELDLVAAECLRARVWADLTPAELAAAVSLLVYEARRDDASSPKLPGGRGRDAIEATMRLAGDVRALEREHRLDVTRVPDAGFAFAAFRWASGHRLDDVLHDADLTAGDFVRWTKQLIDLLGQLAVATDDDELQRTARTAIGAIRRGVVSEGRET